MPKVGMEPIRRKQLIEATLEAVYQFGLADTTIARISKQAGVSSGIIAHYFGGKNELLEATMREILRQLGTGVLTRVKMASSPLERLHAIIDGNFDREQVSPRAATTWLAFWAQALHVKQLARLQRANQLRLRNNLRYWLKQIVTEKARAHEIADGLAALIDGLWLRGAFNEEGINAEECRKLSRQYLALQLASEAPTTSTH